MYVRACFFAFFRTGENVEWSAVAGIRVRTEIRVSIDLKSGYRDQGEYRHQCAYRDQGE